jgi:hypothetical protein
MCVRKLNLITVFWNVTSCNVVDMYLSLSTQENSFQLGSGGIQTSNRCIRVKNTFGLNAVVSRACQLIAFFSVVFFLVKLQACYNLSA